MTAREPGGAGSRGRRRRNRHLLPLLLLLFAIAFLGVMLVARFTPRAPVELSPAATDTIHVREVCGLLARAGSVPPASDGRIDVYAVLKRAGLPRDRILRLCRSETAGKGPTWEQIEAGDYKDFPYQRHRGPFDPEVRPPVPILWHRSRLEMRREVGRVVGYSDASATVLFADEDAALRQFLRDSPGQE